MRDHDTKLRWLFHRGLDLGFPIGEAGRLSVEVACLCLSFSHEGVDPPIRRLDRIRACVPGIDWSAASGRSDPGERCDFRRSHAGAWHRRRSSLCRVGGILGSTIGFWVGDRYGYPLLLRYGSHIGLTETRIKIAQYLFRRQGMVVVLIARFVAVLRSVVGFIAGANRMPFANFMIANSAGAVAWALFYGLGAYYLGKGVEEFAGHSRWRWPWSGRSWWSQ
jgi:membrane protein YqaA with SNARE-associated domain